MSKLKVKIVSPTSVIFEKEVDELVLPTKAGIITVLPEHMNLFTTLDTGVIEAITGEDTEEIFVFGGLVKVRSKDSSVLILADEAGLPSEELLKEVQEAISVAKQKGPKKMNIALEDLIKAEKQLRYLVFKKSSK